MFLGIGRRRITMSCDGRVTHDLLPDDTRIGRVLLRVGSIDQVIPFYRDVIGLEVTDSGDRVILGTGERSVVLLEENPSGPVRSREEAGLFHVAFRVPSRDALGAVLARIRESGWELQGASDHLVSEALYLTDPDGNGVEVYRDRPRSDWPIRPDDQVEMDTLPLDLADLARETDMESRRAPPGTDIGHIHLEVIDRSESEAWYRERLGFSVMARYGEDAVFLGAGGYHHHVGLNTWNRRSVRSTGNRGLGWFEVIVPTAEAKEALLTRIRSTPSRDRDEVSDPNGIVVRVTTPNDTATVPGSGDDR